MGCDYWERHMDIDEIISYFEHKSIEGKTYTAWEVAMEIRKAEEAKKQRYFDETRRMQIVYLKEMIKQRKEKGIPGVEIFESALEDLIEATEYAAKSIEVCGEQLERS